MRTTRFPSRGYQVSPELIDRVRSGKWDSEGTDRDHREALAAFGYWRAFRRVRDGVARVLAGQTAAGLARDEHQEWHRELFASSVTAGIVPPRELAGYRNQPVYIRGSRHVPPRAGAVVDAMEALFDLLEGEPEPAVRAVLGHCALGYIHPWPDGNGRMARFLMNLMLASGGYPWTVIRVGHRAEYMAALDAASSGQRIEPFAGFLAHRSAAELLAARGSAALTRSGCRSGDRRSQPGGRLPNGRPAFPRSRHPDTMGGPMVRLRVFLAFAAVCLVPLAAGAQGGDDRFQWPSFRGAARIRGR